MTSQPRHQEDDMRHPKERLILPRGYSRRDFLRLSGGVAGAALLSACGGASPSPSAGPSGGASATPETGGMAIGSPGDPVEQPLFDDLQAIASDLEPEAGPLRIYNWADYINQPTVDRFAEETGVEVEVTTFYNLDEALRKLTTGDFRTDVFFPTAPVLPKYVAGKLLQPLNHDYLPNLEANVWPELADPFYDAGSRYSVPYALYQTGLAWRTDQLDLDLDDMENPWDVFWDADHKDKVGLYDDDRESLSVALYHNGILDPNTGDRARLEAAAASLVELIDLVNISYSIDGAYVKLPEGKVGIHHAWSGDMVSAPYYMPEGDDPSVLRYLWPPNGASSTTGGLISSDCMAITANAEHPVLAHMFLNFMLDNDNALENFGWTGYQPPLTTINPESLVADEYVPEYLESAIVREGDFEVGQVPLQLTPAVDQLWRQVWSTAQAGG
jgi:spermidine/putrescine transport system substrate-binding protein